MTPKKPPRPPIELYGLDAQLVYFYLAERPKETVTYTFICEKWNVPPHRARAIVSRLSRLGLLATNNKVRPALIFLGNGRPKAPRRGNARGIDLPHLWHTLVHRTTPNEPQEPAPLNPLWWPYMLNCFEKGVAVIGPQRLYSTPDF